MIKYGPCYSQSKIHSLSQECALSWSIGQQKDPLLNYFLQGISITSSFEPHLPPQSYCSLVGQHITWGKAGSFQLNPLSHFCFPLSNFLKHVCSCLFYYFLYPCEFMAFSFFFGLSLSCHLGQSPEDSMGKCICAICHSKQMSLRQCFEEGEISLTLCMALYSLPPSFLSH